jgi:hypothetical protein
VGQEQKEGHPAHSIHFQAEPLADSKIWNDRPGVSF